MAETLLFNLFWLAAGGLAGGFHARSLWGAAHKMTPWMPVQAFLRLAAAMAVLGLAVVAGTVLYAGAGYLLGFIGMAMFHFIRNRRT